MKSKPTPDATSTEPRRLPKNRKGNEFYGTRVPVETIAQIRADAVARGITAGDVIAAAVDAYALPESKALASRHVRCRLQPASH